MQQDPSDPNRPSSTQEQEASAHGAKRSRQSSYATESTEAGPSDAPTTSKYPRILNPSAAGQLSATRDTADMYRSSTPPEASGSGSIKYTRTGRVSKATKGQRVHNCEECGKTYTRAEHLRRHQQNHQPGAYPCDVPGCARSFYREDLLLRHKARHNDPRNPPSRRQSIGSLGSAPEGGIAASDATSAPVPSNSSEVATSEAPTSAPGSDTQQPSEPSRPPKRLPVPPDQLSLGAFPIAIEGPPALVPFTNPWRQSSPPACITNDYDYESSDDFSGLSYPHSHSARTRYSSDASFVGYSQPHSTSRSPASVGSSTLLSTQWPLPINPGTDFATGMLNQCTRPYFDQQSMNGLLYMDAIDIRAAQRDLEEQPQLELTQFALFELSVDDGTDHTDMSTYSRYMYSYWSLVHELYPVLHRQTFDVSLASPLLRASILALGAQGLGQRLDLLNARALHERCIKVLKKRTITGTHTYRVCDMQAIFLIEVFSLFKSRRPPLEFSGHFENICQILRDDPSTVTRASSEPLSEDNFRQPEFGLGPLCIYTESKQRLLLSCYLLVQQCNSLFGRSHDIDIPGFCSNLPFPSSQTTWDDLTGTQHNTSTERVADVFRILQCNGPPQQRFGAFQSSLMIAWLCEDSNDCMDGANDYQTLAFAMEQSARTRLIYHTAMMCKNTPHLRDLLAVAGESWVMGEKLSTETLFFASQVEFRKWASGGYGNLQMIQEAVSHALEILAIHQQTSKTGLLYQEWAVYLAALVIWARAYVQLDERLIGPPLTPSELERSVLSIAKGHSSVDWAAAHNILLWTQMKLQQVDVPHTCGLVSGALDVLGRLVARGSEDGWA